MTQSEAGKRCCCCLSSKKSALRWLLGLVLLAGVLFLVFHQGPRSRFLHKVLIPSIEANWRIAKQETKEGGVSFHLESAFESFPLKKTVLLLAKAEGFEAIEGNFPTEILIYKNGKPVGIVSDHSEQEKAVLFLQPPPR